MGKLERQQKHREFLQKIDTALTDNVTVMEPVGSHFPKSTGEKKFSYVSQQEIHVFGEDVYNFGTPAERGKLSALKNAASNLVLVDSPGKDFPASERFRTEFKALQKRNKEYKAMVAKDPVLGMGWNNINSAINADYRSFRDKALSHVISTSQKDVPDWLQGMTTKVAELYSALDTDYRSRKAESSEDE